MLKPLSVLFATSALSFMPSAALAKDGLTVDETGLHVSTMDGDLALRVGGKFNLDALAVEDDGGDYSDAAIRRARIDVRLEYEDVVTLRAEREFAGSKGWRNLYALVRPFKGALVQAGQFNVPFSLEDMQSTNVIAFPERSLASALTSEFAMGVQGGYSGKRFSVRGGYFGDALDTPSGPSPSLGRGLVGRATVLAIDGRDIRIHLGLGLERRSFRQDEAMRFVADAGSNFGPRISRTPQLGNLNRRTGYNAELAVLAGNFAAQGQYVQQSLREEAGFDRRVSGGYMQASWLLTGQRYLYSRRSGTITGPDMGKRRTAVEVAGRVSWLDADNRTINGGTARSIDLSAGTYFGRNVRLLASGSQSRYRERAGDPVHNALVAVTRLQLAF